MYILIFYIQFYSGNMIDLEALYNIFSLWYFGFFSLELHHKSQWYTPTITHISLFWYWNIIILGSLYDFWPR